MDFRIFYLVTFQPSQLFCYIASRNIKLDVQRKQHLFIAFWKSACCIGPEKSVPGVILTSFLYFYPSVFLFSFSLFFAAPWDTIFTLSCIIPLWYSPKLNHPLVKRESLSLRRISIYQGVILGLMFSFYPTLALVCLVLTHKSY